MSKIFLDLHGVYHEDVENKVYSFINRNKDECIKIITGNSDTMKKIVFKVVGSLGLKHYQLIGSEVIVWT